MITIIIDGQEYLPKEDADAVGVEYWYDRSRRHWVLYPVDAEGNQMAEARYGFSKKEAMMIKADIENDYNI